jgi:hypothetical protein
MKDADDYSPEEISRRRDTVIKRMIATPPTPHTLPKRKKVRRQRTKATKLST